MACSNWASGGIPVAWWTRLLLPDWSEHFRNTGLLEFVWHHNPLSCLQRQLRNWETIQLCGGNRLCWCLDAGGKAHRGKRNSGWKNPLVATSSAKHPQTIKKQELTRRHLWLPPLCRVCARTRMREMCPLWCQKGYFLPIQICGRNKWS